MGSRTFIFLLLLSVLTVTGCYNKPVRHLASDVGLLRVGTSTQEDVMVYLGEPDEQQEIGNGVEKWLYKDEDRTLFEKTPLVGKRIGSPEYRRAVVTLTNGIVTKLIYSSSDQDDLDWANDYSWQEKKK